MKSMKGFEGKLARRFIFYVIMTSTIFTVLTSAFQLYDNYLRDIANVDSRLDELERTQLSALSQRLWDLDDEGLNAAAQSIFASTLIQYIEIWNDENLVIALGEKKRGAVKRVDFPLLHEAWDETRQIGTLVVHASLEQAYEHVYDLALIIIVGNAIKTFIVSGIILLIFYQIIGRHLTGMGKFAENVIASQPIQELRLEREPSTAKTYDELDFVVSAINTMQTKLTDTAKLYRGYFELGSIGMVVTCPEKGFIQINDKACEVFGYPRDELFKLSWADITHPDDLEADETEFNRVLAGEIDEYEMEKRFIQQDGKVIQTLLSVKGVPKKDGSIGHLIAFIQDITERKNVEAQLRQAQKMEAVGQLAGGIAHDFNNILGIILGNLELLKMQSTSEQTSNRIDSAMHGTKRAAEITKKLLSFSGKEELNTKRVVINELIINIEDFISKSLTASISVETHLAPELWEVNIDSGDLEDAIVNLSLNARDAMPEGGTLIIETANKVLDEAYVEANLGAKSGEFVAISISDTGGGMAEDVKSQVFEPFFSTKKTGKGTGLGLSMVYGFLLRSGGLVKIYSEVGEGTTIHLFLPRAAAEKTGPDWVDNGVTVLPTGTETVLVVDDEEGLLDIAVSLLENLGYKTLAAKCGKDALSLIQGNDKIDMLFTDVVMPGNLDGYQLALAAHQANPALTILLASGFTNKRKKYANVEGSFLLQLSENLLNKPYSLRELAIAVRRTLDQPI